MFEVKKKCCSKCLFGKNKIVSDASKDNILEGCVHNDSHFICHEASIANKDVCCRGFYATQDTNLIRISQRMGWVRFVD